MLLLCTFDCDARGGTETAGSEAAAALWDGGFRPICHVYRTKRLFDVLRIEWVCVLLHSQSLVKITQLCYQAKSIGYHIHWALALKSALLWPRS